MNQNKNQNPIIAWISVLLGSISSLILLLILWKRPAPSSPAAQESVPKIKLPEDDEAAALLSTSLVKTPAKLPAFEELAASKDDLKKIEGIGPKISQLLSDHQINTFRDLSKMKVEALRTLLTDANIRIADPATWPEQAAYAAKQDWEGLRAFQQDLKGGRRES